MVCSIIAVNFVDQNNNIFPTCQVASGSTVKVEARFTLDVSTNAFMYYILDTPNGRTGYWSSMKTFIVPQGSVPTFTQYLTSSEGFNVNTPGNYSVYAVQVVNETKTLAICTVTDPLQSCMTLVVGQSQQTLGNISITPNVSVNVGESATLSVSCTDTNYNSMTCPTLNWMSNNQSVATISNGVVTGMSPGTTTIYAVHSGTGIISNSCQVNVPTYACINNVCTKTTCTFGTTGCYTEPTCAGTCQVSGWTCNPVSCPNDGTNYCLSGQCISKNLVFGGAALLIIMMMMR